MSERDPRVGRLTPAQRAVVAMLRTEDAYIRETRWNRYELANSGRRVLGRAIDPALNRRTVERLKHDGLIVKDIRQSASRRQMVGYFLIEDLRAEDAATGRKE